MRLRNSILILTILAIGSVFSEESNNKKVGFKVMYGGRYDDVRMCVASDPGVKGGMIADIMLLTRFPLKKKRALSLEIPVMRPILFAAAFKMLQFEPQATLEFKKELSDKKSIIAGPGAGLSFHYGPDYKSDKENQSTSFFALGPIVSGMIGYEKVNEKGYTKRIGIRGFYIPLLTADDAFEHGNVLGVVVEGQFTF